MNTSLSKVKNARKDNVAGNLIVDRSTSGRKTGSQEVIKATPVIERLRSRKTAGMTKENAVDGKKENTSVVNKKNNAATSLKDATKEVTGTGIAGSKFRKVDEIRKTEAIGDEYSTNNHSKKIDLHCMTDSEVKEHEEVNTTRMSLRKFVYVPGSRCREDNCSSSHCLAEPESTVIQDIETNNREGVLERKTTYNEEMIEVENKDYLTSRGLVDERLEKRSKMSLQINAKEGNSVVDQIVVRNPAKEVNLTVDKGTKSRRTKVFKSKKGVGKKFTSSVLEEERRELSAESNIDKEQCKGVIERKTDGEKVSIEDSNSSVKVVKKSRDITLRRTNSLKRLRSGRTKMLRTAFISAKGRGKRTASLFEGDKSAAMKEGKKKLCLGWVAEVSACINADIQEVDTLEESAVDSGSHAVELKDGDEEKGEERNIEKYSACNSKEETNEELLHQTKETKVLDKYKEFKPPSQSKEERPEKKDTGPDLNLECSSSTKAINGVGKMFASSMSEDGSPKMSFEENTSRGNKVTKDKTDSDRVVMEDGYESAEVMKMSPWVL